MSVFNLSLDETELLLLQQVMEGRSNTVGYQFQMANLEKADFSNEGPGDMFKNEVVKEADDYGFIRKVHFDIDHPQFSQDEDVTLRVHSDGRITSTRKVPENLVNELRNYIREVRGYDEFTTPLNKRVDRVLDLSTSGGTTPTQMKNYAADIFDAFDDLLNYHYPGDELSGEEERTYESIIAGIGIYYIENGIPDPSTSIDVPDEFEIRPYDGNIEKFFSRYALHEADNDIEYADLAKHLDYLLRQDWKTPIGMIEAAKDAYK